MSKRGRPRALLDPNNPFLKVMEEVLSDHFNVLALTDAELMDEINERLRDMGQTKYMMSQSWFEKNKRLVLEAESEDDLDDLDPNFVEFLRLIKKGSRHMKKGLTMAMLGINFQTGDKYKNDPFWTRFSWMLERKWPDEFGNPEKKQVGEGEDDPQSELKAAFVDELIPESKKIK